MTTIHMHNLYIVVVLHGYHIYEAEWNSFIAGPVQTISPDESYNRFAPTAT